MGQTTFAAEKDTYPPENNLFPEYRLIPGDQLDVLFQIQTLRAVEDYTVTPNDTLTIKFVHFPELNETQRVRPDGNISLGYVGDVYVVGKTPQQLKLELERSYAHYFRNPQVYVTVDEFRLRIKELKKDLHTASRGLSRLVTVRPDGYATFPLAGDLLVAHKTIPEVRQELDTFYNGYLTGLHVDLFLEEHAGAVIYVLGMVEESGAHKISKPISVLQALALAGGPKTVAGLDTVLIFRRNGKEFTTTRVNLEDPLQTAQGSQLFFLRPDDIVYVPESKVFETARIMRAIADIILFRGWGITFSSDALQSSSNE
ncbi:MAG: polysaccharide biosynthesis/export family protein [Desulfovibrio sp.]